MLRGLPLSESGTEHIGPEETFDADYGRLLEQVQNNVKWVASPKAMVTSRGPLLSVGLDFDGAVRLAA